MLPLLVGIAGLCADLIVTVQGTQGFVDLRRRDTSRLGMAGGTQACGKPTGVLMHELMGHELWDMSRWDVIQLDIRL